MDLRTLLPVDIARLMETIALLSAFSDAPAPAVTRVLYTETDVRARDFLKALMQEAGLTLREDALGNLFARWEGSDPNLSAVATGSHTDAIPHSGRYDGVVGVLGGLEAIRALQSSGFAPKRSIELIMFTSEEPTRFGVGCLGSRAMAGTLSAEKLRTLTDEAGVTLEGARQEAGFSGDLENVQLEPGHYHAFIELHIEQGPRLEQERVEIGVVTAIAAPATLYITVQGEGGHAGTVLMAQRKDALMAASEIGLALEAATLASGSTDTVGTVGIIDIHPRAVNSIPSRIFMTADIRDIDLGRRDEVIRKLKEAVQEISKRRHVGLEVETINADPPAVCGEVIVAAAEASAKELGYSYQHMVSRAYHDSLFMARLSPTGMIFIPSKGGVSHRPDEYSSPEEIERGVRVLAATLARLSS